MIDGDFPTEDQLRWAMLRVLDHGQPIHRDPMLREVAKLLRLTEEQVQRPLPNSSERVLQNRTSWVKGERDRQFGYFEKFEDDGVYRLTDTGMAAARDPNARGVDRSWRPTSPPPKRLSSAERKRTEAEADNADRYSTHGLAARREFDPSRTPTRPTMRTREDMDWGARIAALEKANKNHHAILVAVNAWLSANGWRDIFEQSGAIDLGATTPPDTTRHAIFEAKTIGEANELSQTRRSIGQLLEYRHFQSQTQESWKDAMLCLVTNQEISDKRARLLEALGIAVLLAPTDGGALDFQNRRGRRILGA